MRVFECKGRDASRIVTARVSRILACGGTGAIIAILMLAASEAEAARHPRYHAHAHHAAVGFAPARVSESIVIDVETGKVLSAANADAITYPASLTKMMTLYLTFEALNAGRLRPDQYLPVSYEAASRSPTKLGLRPGESIAVQDLILGLVTRSANDAASVLAEGLAGNEPVFAEQMTRMAGQLGMTSTVYRNASGLPDPDQYTTARDEAQLALALYRDFPREYRYFSTRQFYFRGKIIHNHNHLLDWYEGADGIKTGYIGASGFNLAASAVRNGHRLIGVIMGGPSAGTRDREMAALLDQGFNEVGAGAIVVARHEAPLAAPTPAVAEAEQPQPTPSQKPGLLTKAAARLAAHLAPIGKAEAAPLAHEQRAASAGEHWSIQLGAFRAESAAAKAARAAASLPTAKGKPLQIVEPPKGDKERLYRARLLNFTPQEAWSACIALHKKNFECSVVPPAGLKVANR
ncbi:MAG TPA: D-alanyl-D-alanine carboxypeptidase family protein [Stellaceae bacterium]|nr:D-alanyl-D-alanine carboxypeptidase family protein [Stellaceae bacterium]